ASDGDASDGDASDGDARASDTRPPDGVVAAALAEPEPVAADETPPDASPTNSARGSLPAVAGTEVPPARDVASLFARISVTRTDSGGMRLEVPPDAAGELSQLLEGLAGLLRSAAGPIR